MRRDGADDLVFDKFNGLRDINHSPASLFITESTSARRLAVAYWKDRQGLEASKNAPSTSNSSRISTETRHKTEALVASWRSQARKKVARMSYRDRHQFLAKLGLPGYAGSLQLGGLMQEDEKDNYRRSSTSPSLEPGSPSSASTTDATFDDCMSSANGRAAVDGAGTGKRKADKFSSESGIAKARKLDMKSKTGRLYQKPSREESCDGRTTFQADTHDNEEEEEEDDDDDDDLTNIVRRQRQAFSARQAAGRPSARDGPSFAYQVNKPRVLRTVSPKLVRSWKIMAKKSASKAGRQKVALRRDLIAMAKRAAKECARFMRQQFVASHKMAKDVSRHEVRRDPWSNGRPQALDHEVNGSKHAPLTAPARAHRLTREVAGHWRAAASSSGTLNITGVKFPLTEATTHIPTSVQFIDTQYTASLKSGDSVALLAGTNGATAGSDNAESAASVRKRMERAAAEQRKADLELLEARRQQRKLNFLITQTELYAHFMARKLGNQPQSPNADENLSTDYANTADSGARQILSRLDDDVDDEFGQSDSESKTSGSKSPRPIGQNIEDDASAAIDRPNEQDKPVAASTSSVASAAKAAADRLGVNIDDEYDAKALKSRALTKVMNAVEKQRIMDLNYEKPGHQVVTSSKVCGVKSAPSIFKGELKAYQICGLNWLLGLYDQGINGILADEMGLGKTIQTIAFLGYLAQIYNIWGPFLIVSPASTLHNWTQEFAKFLPEFHLVPYWGTPAERKVLRRFWPSAKPAKKHPAGHDGQDSETRDNEGDDDDDDDGVGDVDGQADGAKSTSSDSSRAQFHVVVTSYQIVLQDAKFINKTSWSYIVLDEAHAIKSTNSMRWRILLSFKCRNRLLLTGTPIQNTMQELWALLHFIMPTLFDSHDEFANWFSRDIESQAASATSTSTSSMGGALSTSKLDENQLSRLHLILKPFMLRRTKAEVEHEISDKIEIMRYCPLSHRQSLLYSRLRNKIRFEDLSSMIHDSDLDSSELKPVGASVTANLINLVMQLRKVCNHPDLWERRDVQFACTTGAIDPDGARLVELANQINGNNHVICGQSTSWTLPTIMYDEGFSFSRLMGLSPAELSSALNSSQHHYHHRPTSVAETVFSYFSSNRHNRFTWPGHLLAKRGCPVIFQLCAPSLLTCLLPWNSRSSDSRLSETLPSNGASLDALGLLSQSGFIATAAMHKVFLAPLRLHVNVPAFTRRYNQLWPVVTRSSSTDWLRWPDSHDRTIEPVPIMTRISDSGKLVQLDLLLQELKRDGHRVLVYSQMTRMIDILEEFMIYRKHAYLRLDGSSRLCDRRDMVAQWQTNPRWFVFLLSTRAGGLGINLTAADTVIFYDSDWNPTVDQQAMDRAHRLGQTKTVTVYRLICQGTVEGRMLQRAEEKRAMQHMVIQSGQPGAIAAPSERDSLTSTDMVSLLLDDDELVKRLQQRRRQQTPRGRPSKVHVQQPSESKASLVVRTNDASRGRDST